jgi:bifunctional DNA-binding transcriptional regulator/antitoxin component of YhaV-PrlF toxin-antitoxin module
MDPKFIGKAKITKQGQVTMPFEARDDLEIELNSEVYWYEVGDFLIVLKELINHQALANKLNKKKGVIKK